MYQIGTFTLDLSSWFQGITKVKRLICFGARRQRDSPANHEVLKSLQSMSSSHTGAHRPHKQHTSP